MSDTSPRVLVTGAYGTIGRQTLPNLVGSGCTVIASDVETKLNAKHDSALRTKLGHTTVWTDISDAAAVDALVAEAQPTHIIHLASVIPPYVYANHERSLKINVEGTKNVWQSAQKLESKPHCVLASSHTVHGWRNGARDLPLLAADSPKQGTEVYTRGKIECEETLQNSGLPWTILRFGIVFPLEYSKKLDPNLVRFGYLVPLNSRTHAVHLEDAGLATANSIRPEAAGKVLMIGGDDRWKQRHRFYLEGILGAVGVGMLPDDAYVDPCPDNDHSWFYNDWMDTTESQELLDYQRYSPEEFFTQLAANVGWMRPLTRMVAPLVRRKLAGLSPFYKDEEARKASDVTLEERIAQYTTPTPPRS